MATNMNQQVANMEEGEEKALNLWTEMAEQQRERSSELLAVRG